VLGAVRERWGELPQVTSEQIDAWIETGRGRPEEAGCA
jgi:hypothetical protein